MRPFTSSKTNQSDKIGSKGLGFRSVLSWANKIEIKTKEFAVEFSKENAIEVFNSIVQEKPSLKTELEKKSNVEYPISILSCPKILDDVLCDSEFDTVIKIYCNEDGAKEIKDQMSDFQSKEMVFLPKLKRIDFIFKSSIDLHYIKNVSNDVVNIQCDDLITGDSKREIDWKLYSDSGVLDIEVNEDDELVPEYNIVIAYDVDNQTSGQYLYSYFRTDVEFKFPALIHGTFELSPDRNQIVKTAYNRALFEKIADGLVKVASSIAENSEESNYEALKLVLSTQVSDFLTKFNFKKLLYQKSKSAKILPTVKNEYISYNDNPKYSDYEYSKFVNPDDFDNLLKWTDDSDVNKYLGNSTYNYGLGLSFYSNEEFIDKINSSIAKYSIDDKCKLIVVLKNDSNFSNKPYPNLLEDAQGNVIEHGNCVFINDGKNIKIPSWVKVGLLKDEMKDTLMNLCEETTTEGLCSELKAFGLRPYRFENLYSKVISEVNSIGDEIEKKEKFKEVFYWLWDLYKDNKLNSNLVSGLDEKIYVLCIDGEYKPAKECYLGSDYKNYIGEKIVSIFNNKNFVSKDLIISGDEIRFESFLKTIGVAKYPRLVSIDLNQKSEDVKRPFWRYISNHDNKKFRECFAKLGYIDSMQVETYENFELILKTISSNDLIMWMLDDQDFYFRLNCPSEVSPKSGYTGYVDQSHSGDRVRLNNYNYRTYKNDEMPSYITYQLKTYEWINIDESNNKVSPEFCMRENLKLEPIIFSPYIDENYICKKLGTDCRKDIENILYKVGVSNGFTSLKKETIYRILLNLKNTDPNGIHAKKIYKMVKDYCKGDSVDALIANNLEYDKFKKEGYVFVTENGVGKYVRNNEAYYSNLKIFSPEIIKQYPFIVVDYKSGLRKIMNIFCVNELKSVQTTLVSADDSIFNNEFQAYYNDFIPYVLACKYITNKNTDEHRRNLKKYKVNLCNNIIVKYNSNGTETDGRIENYQFFVDENVKNAVKAEAYISISDNEFDSFDEMKKKLQFADAVADTICFILKSEEDKQFIRDLFVNSEEDRKYKIRNDKYDEELTNLYKAIRDLKEISDYKLYFWQTVCDINKTEYKENSSYEELITNLGLNQEDTDAIDYDSIANGTFNGPYDKLIIALRSAKVDIDSINSRTGFSISVMPWWERIVNQLKQEYKYEYLMHLYHTLKDDEECTSKYLQYSSDFSKMPDEIINSVFIDIYKIMYDTYGILFNNHRYDQNELINIIENNKNKLSGDDISKIRKEYSTQEIDAFALFDRLNDLLVEETAEDEKVYSDNDLRKLSEETSSTADDIEIQKVIFQLPKTSEEEPKLPERKRPTNTTKNAAKANETKKVVGSVGEKIVYDKLREKYAVDWVSGYAETNKIIPKGKGDDTLGYDMKYIDSKGDTHYIEVKTTVSDDIEFTMSENEKRAAEKYKDNYCVMFVMLEKMTTITLQNIFIS